MPLYCRVYPSNWFEFIGPPIANIDATATTVLPVELKAELTVKLQVKALLVVKFWLALQPPSLIALK